MRFQDKLDRLMKEMNLKNATLAKISGMDASLISRFRSGRRVPTQNSPQICRLAYGLVSLCEKQDRCAQLRKICNIRHASTHEAMAEAVCRYLAADDSQLKPPRARYSTETHALDTTGRIPDTPNSPLTFADKLNALMRIMGITNARLARYLGVHASLVSRLRSGTRTPPTDSHLITKLCTYFSICAKTQLQTKALFELLKLPLNTSTLNNHAQLHETLYQWLCPNNIPSADTSVDSFLSCLDTYDPGLELPSPNFPLPTPGGTTHTAQAYYGNEGFRQAALRLLNLALQQTQSRKILLYCDMPLDWLLESNEFCQEWLKLLQVLSTRKHEIQIIHCLNRGSKEMISTLQTLLPLYLFGHIQPYFCHQQSDPRFSHTLFAIAGVAALSTCCPSNNLFHAAHIFTTEPLQVDYNVRSFVSILKNCDPLMHVLQPQTMDAAYPQMDEFRRIPGNVKVLSACLSPSTMAPTQLSDMLARRGMENIAPTLLRYQRILIARLESALKKGQVTEYFHLPSFKDLESGSVSVGFPTFLLDRPFTYTSEEFSKHIESILHTLQHHKAYRFRPLPVPPFRNLHILIKPNVGTLIRRLDQPTAFLFDHPLLCAAFEAQLEAIVAAEQNNASFQAPLNVADHLQQYLN